MIPIPHFPIHRYLHSPILPFPHSRMQWLCSYCHAPYNRDQIESNLIKAVQRRSDSFCLQDLVCVKCRGVSHVTSHDPHRTVMWPQVKEANMSNYCSCAGGFALTVTRETLLEQMMTFRNIARWAFVCPDYWDVLIIEVSWSVRCPDQWVVLIIEVSWAGRCPD